MPKSRKDAWLRDEVILALDLYRREGRNPSDADLEEVSQQLRAIPIEENWADENPKFRNPTGVYLKVANFVALDPTTGTKGMTRGSKLDAEVFADFWERPDRLEQAADAIRANLEDASAAKPLPDGPELEEAPEGRLLTRVHRSRERNPALVKKKKAQVLQEKGRLACEVCDFDFFDVYGDRGKGFIECHHLIPVRDLRPGSRTKLNDLALLCANCHRMVHARSRWLDLDDLRSLIGGDF
jgi:5-methylcytosine-specific restriction protein A